MKLKDLLGISLVSIFLFPIILIGIMLAAGVVHLEFGNGKDKDRLKQTYSGDDQAKQDEAEAKQLKAYKALELKETELKDKEADVARETERLEGLKLETARAKDEIESHRKKIEELVGKSAEAQDKQIASLAEVYGGMRPDEAAPIMLSLDDAMVVRILRKIPETRATSKLLAAIAALDVKRAARFTTLLGGKSKQPVAVDTNSVKAEPPVANAGKNSGGATSETKAPKGGNDKTPGIAKPPASPTAAEKPTSPIGASLSGNEPKTAAGNPATAGKK